jgi:hypothetical protein
MIASTRSLIYAHLKVSASGELQPLSRAQLFCAKWSDHLRAIGKLQKRFVITALAMKSTRFPILFSHFTKKSLRAILDSPDIFAGTTFADYQVGRCKSLPREPKQRLSPSWPGYAVVGRPNQRCSNSPAFPFSDTARCGANFSAREITNRAK